MQLSIIIPTYNEADNIASLVEYLSSNANSLVAEIIVADGGSTDHTIQAAQTAGAIAVISPNKGRAAQMNYGASLAKAEILYFVHADSFPPKKFATDIIDAVNNGYALGRYQTKFDTNNWLLKMNAFFTRFDWAMCSGGDQTLFITKQLFSALNGYDGSMHIMEEYDLVKRARATSKYKIFSGKALISSRKYDTNSWLQVQKANYTVLQMYKNGASQKAMVNCYKKMLKYR